MSLHRGHGRSWEGAKGFAGQSMDHREGRVAPLTEGQDMWAASFFWAAMENEAQVLGFPDA